MISLKNVFQAYFKIKNYVRKTPLDFSSILSNVAKANVFLKLENYQVTGSFKIRGALNKIIKNLNRAKKRGVITASTGNHGLAVAYASKIFNVKSKIIVATNVSKVKLNKIKQYGSEIVFHGKDYDEAEEYAKKLAEQESLIYISPYNDLDIIEANATIALETFTDNPDIDTFIVPIGGGGLISGIAFLSKKVSKDIGVIGVQSENSPAMYESIKKGKIVKVPLKPSLADGLHGNVEENSITFDFVQKYVDEIILVSEEDIRQAIKFSLEKLGILIEGSAAVTIASILNKKWKSSGKNVCLIISGGNIDIQYVKEVLSR
nr:threonine/serine dehydratase [Candidatus Baldrarchaeota archaeon]